MISKLAKSDNVCAGFIFLSFFIHIFSVEAAKCFNAWTPVCQTQAFFVVNIWDRLWQSRVSYMCVLVWCVWVRVFVCAKVDSALLRKRRASVCPCLRLWEVEQDGKRWRKRGREREGKRETGWHRMKERRRERQPAEKSENKRSLFFYILTHNCLNSCLWVCQIGSESP